jgi:ABC-type transport system substrate-binding protein
MAPYAAFFPAYGAPQIHFEDPGYSWNSGQSVWRNIQNYWSWAMMIATNGGRALFAAIKSQEAMQYLALCVPLYVAQSFTTFSRRYVGNTAAEVAAGYTGQPWKGVINQKSFGVWSTWSFYNMHPSGYDYGNGKTTGSGVMTIRWGFRQPTMSLNPVYADSPWDWYVLDQCYDSLIGYNPYNPAEEKPWLATTLEVETWDGSALGLGTCTMITFHLRHDVEWSDDVPFTSSDVKFTWGGPLVTDSLSNILAKRQLPMPCWGGNVADILSVATPDPWTAIVYLDVYAFFGLHSMSGYNLVLPEHIWKPIAQSDSTRYGSITGDWNMPCVVTGGFIISNTGAVTVGDTILLVRNHNHFNMDFDGDLPNVKTLEGTLGYPSISSDTDFSAPFSIWTMQSSNATSEIGNIH